jgi:outer membrane protein assembly factor BamB
MKSKLVGLVISMLLFATTLSVAAPLNKDEVTTENAISSVSTDWWPMFQHDLTHSGLSTSNVPATNATIWITPTDYFMRAPATIVDGKVYVTGLTLETGGRPRVFCLNSETGATIWIQDIPTGTSAIAAPAVVNNRVYIGFNNGIMYCFDAIGNGNGTTNLIWSYVTGSVISNSPAVYNGNVYFGAVNKKVYCLNATGNGNGTTNLVWSYLTGGGITYSSAAIANGRVYIASNDKKIYCLDAVGNGNGTTNVIWRYLTNGTAPLSPTIANGKVYLASDKIYCVNAQGNGDGTTNLIWMYPKSSSSSSTAIADGKVYFGTGKTIYCLNATGNGDGTTSKIWQRNVSGYQSIQSSPVIANGKVLIAAGSISQHREELYCLDAMGNGSGGTTQLWNYSFIGTPTSYTYAGPTIANDKVYFGSLFTKSVYCFYTNNAPLKPDTPTGPTSGLVGQPMTFSSKTTDPDGDQIYYQWKFGSYTTGWIGPNASGEVVHYTYMWTSPGTYKVSVKAKDSYVQGPSSDELTVVIKKTTLVIGSIAGGNNITVMIKNTGYADATQVSVLVEITGGLFVSPRNATRSFSTIAAGASAPLYVSVFGIGFGFLKPIPTITVTIGAPNVDTVLKNATARILFTKITIISEG